MSSNRFRTGGAGGVPSHEDLFVPDLSHAIRKIAKEDFRSATPTGLLSVVMALPSEKSEFYIDFDDSMMRRALDHVRERCQVWIDCFGNEGYIVISARKIQHVRSGLKEVRDWVFAQSKELEGNAATLVHRIGGSPRSCIILKPTQELGLGNGIADGWRGVAKLNGAKDEDTSTNIPGNCLYSAQRNGQNGSEQVITKQLLDAIEQAARLMRPDVGRKYVRVHLGLRSLSKRKVKGKACDEYTTSEFGTLMSSATKRGHVSFRICFGGENLTKAILQHTHETDNPEDPAIRRFVAPDATIDRLKDVKPRFCLIFFSGNLRIEMDIQAEPARTTSQASFRGANRLNLPTASSPRIFRFNKTVDAEIAVACPDMKVDWQLSVDSDLSADRVHDRFRDLANELRFDDMSEDGLTFPAAHASRVSLRKAKIDSVACKAIWTFECVKAPCRIDFTEYYDWDAYPLSKFMEKYPRFAHFTFSTTGRNCPNPDKSCAVSLYGDDWDEKMRDISPASGKFADQIIDLFGHGIEGEQYIDNLLQEIELLLDITTQAATDTEPPLGPPIKATTMVTPVVDSAAQAATEVESLIDFTD